MNPAIALGIALSGFFGDGWDSWKAIYLYPTVPFGAAVVAVVFYEFIFKKTIEALSQYDTAGDLGHRQSMLGADHEERIARTRTKDFHPVRQPTNSSY